MDPELLEKAILDRKEKTGKYPKAIIPVALYGMPYQIDRIMEIANKYDIPIIEDAAEGMGSRFNGQILGTFGKFGVLSFNGNKMITTSGGGALICRNAEDANTIMWYATQARDAYPYYQHTAIGFNYRMSNVCAGIGRGQMTVLDQHIAHHKHVQALYEDLMKDIPGIRINKQPNDPKYDSNYWLSRLLLVVLQVLFMLLSLLLPIVSQMIMWRLCVCSCSARRLSVVQFGSQCINSLHMLMHLSTQMESRKISSR